ncbi:MAG: UTP--glucose-1-phosphate uridylyltransferase [Faecalibacterium sp.]
MKKITKAVIPAAGLGTRVLPATKAMPKGMLPIVDKPAIQYLVEEAVAAGCTDILIIISRNQDLIADHFDRCPELEARLAVPGKEKLLEECLGIANLANIMFVRQKETLGLGHAVLMAKPFTGADPFLVVYGDDVIIGEDPACAQLIRAYEAFGRPACAVNPVPWEDVSRYCSLKTTPIHDNYFFVDDMIEKPKKGQEFSNYSILGRVLLTAEIYDIIEGLAPGAGGEIQLTDAMAEVSRNRGGMTAVHFTGKRYDMGDKLSVVQAQVELALQHPEIKDAFRAYLKDFCAAL